MTYRTTNSTPTTEKGAAVTDPTRRHDFLFAFDCTRGNPNGDFDAANAPRQDPETGQGWVTSVCLKRKIRNWVEVAAHYYHAEDSRRRQELGIFIRHGDSLNGRIREAYAELGLIGRAQRPLPEGPAGREISALAAGGSLPEGFSLPAAQGGDGQRPLSYDAGDRTPEDLKAALDALARDEGLSGGARALLEEVAADASRPTGGREDEERARRYMLERYYDVRLFGAVMRTGLNAGQVRGPVQLVDAVSVDPVTVVDMTLPRRAVTREEDRERTDSTLADKKIIPYGLYLARGYFTPPYADDTGVSPEDLSLFWRALEEMWVVDRCHIRPMMTTVGLWVFSHDSPLGDAPDHLLFRRIRVRRKPNVEVARAATDYEYEVLHEDLPAGVTLTTLVEPPLDDEGDF